MNRSVYCIAYVSSLAGELDDVDIELLLRISRERNQRKNISGFLLLCERSVFQILQGDRDTVEDLYLRIASDRRHHHVTRILTTEIEGPTFENWNMGFRKLEKRELLQCSPELLSQFWEPVIAEHPYSSFDPRGVRLLLSFLRATGLRAADQTMTTEPHAPGEESITLPKDLSA